MAAPTLALCRSESRPLGRLLGTTSKRLALPTLAFVFPGACRQAFAVARQTGPASTPAGPGPVQNEIVTLFRERPPDVFGKPKRGLSGASDQIFMPTISPRKPRPRLGGRDLLVCVRLAGADYGAVGGPFGKHSPAVPWAWAALLITWPGGIPEASAIALTACETSARAPGPENWPP